MLIWAFSLFAAATGWGLWHARLAMNLLLAMFPFSLVVIVVWFYLLVSLIYLIFGSVTVSVANGNLVIAFRAMGLVRTLTFPANEIRNLEPAPGIAMSFLVQPSVFGFPGSMGSVQFAQGGIHFSFGERLDANEARQVIDWLRQRLPGAA